jgi:hypothetical protein
MTYLLAAVAASGVFIAAGWRSRRILNASAPADGYELPIDPLWGEATTDQPAGQSQSDAETAVRLALKRLGPLLKSQSVQADIAVAPNLLVRMRVSALADLVEELLGAAVHAAPASRLLLTASAQGDHVEIATTDDVPNADPDLRAARVRGLMERVSIRGGSLHIDVRPSEGTTMTLRLAAGAERRGSPRQAPPIAGWMTDRRTVEP